MSLFKRTTKTDDEPTDAKSIRIEIEDDEAETGGRGRARKVALGALAGAAALVWWRRRRSRTAEIERESMAHAAE
jgi:hypothetical protein